MPPKRDQRRAASSLLSSEEEENDGDETRAQQTAAAAAAAKQGGFTLHPKPCLCCGREITPRRKWARNWDSIRFCSDQCRHWRSVVPLTWLDDRVESGITNGRRKTLLDECLCIPSSSSSSSNSTTVLLSIDAWIEATIVLVARTSTVRSYKSLGDVSTKMHEDVAQCFPSVSKLIDCFLRQTTAGEREIVRRAARRLVVLPKSSLAMYDCLSIDCSGAAVLQSAERIVLSQQSGKRKLVTLSDVSHAKGPIEISISSDR